MGTIKIDWIISYYVKPHLRIRINHISRHEDDREMLSSESLSIFSKT